MASRTSRGWPRYCSGESAESLPPEQACLIRGLAVEGVSYAELARRHGLPLGTVMSRVSRGRARLAERLGDGFRWMQRSEITTGTRR